jgi:retron-type reverse transcriptase
MTHEREKSDRVVVPKRSPNKAERTVAEAMEGRTLAKGNSRERNAPRTQRRPSTPSALERVRQAAKRDRKQRFTALLHHVYDLDRLRLAYRLLKRDAAAGMDGETWRHYGERLEDNLRDLSERLRKGAYRARPVRRAYIPKADGRRRPLGVPVLEDKLVQRATTDVLNAIYETDFRGFSYGFRPGRTAHQAIGAVRETVIRGEAHWVVEADIKGFFDHLDHAWLMRMLEERIGDPWILRLIRKWLTAGILEEGHETTRVPCTFVGRDWKD